MKRIKANREMDSTHAYALRPEQCFYLQLFVLVVVLVVVAFSPPWGLISCVAPVGG